MMPIKETLTDLGREIYRVSWTLFKLMIPVLIAVKILEELGAIVWISALLEPVMGWVGLPESMGLVWATTLLVNIYGGMLIFFQLAPQETLTIAQVSVLGVLMLMAHGLPVELRIVQLAGVRMGAALLIRIGGALLLAVIVDRIYRWGGWFEQPVELVWQPPAVDASLSAWIVGQLENLLMIQLIVIVMLSLLRFLRWIHVERLMIWLLQPLLRLLGIGPQATSLTIIGVTLGLSFGGGLLIHEARQGHIDKKDIFSALALLGLLHSVIEDTLLIMLLGADLSAILWMRLLFTILVVSLLTRWMRSRSDGFRQRYLVREIEKIAPAEKMR